MASATHTYSLTCRIRLLGFCSVLPPSDRVNQIPVRSSCLPRGRRPPVDRQLLCVTSAEVSSSGKRGQGAAFSAARIPPPIVLSSVTTTLLTSDLQPLTPLCVRVCVGGCVSVQLCSQRRLLTMQEQRINCFQSSKLTMSKTEVTRFDTITQKSTLLFSKQPHWHN